MDGHAAVARLAAGHSPASPSKSHVLRGAVFFFTAIAPLALVGPAARTATAANFVVTDLGDAGPNTLRDAITQANALPGSTITFDTSGVVQLLSPLPAIQVDMTIQGQSGVIISGGNLNRVFFVEAGTVLIQELDIVNGAAVGGNGGDGGGGGGLGAGGGLFVNQAAHVTLRRVEFENNNASGGDGGAASASGGGGGGGITANSNGAAGANALGGAGGGPNPGVGGPNAGQGGQSGGDFSGGGGGASNLAGIGGNGGAGGFGGGGGGGGAGTSNGAGGSSGFGGGTAGSGAIAGGEAGAAYGGAIFVRSGGTLVLEDSNLVDSDASPGVGHSGPGPTGGAAVYLGGGATEVVVNNESLFYFDAIGGPGGIEKSGELTFYLNGDHTYTGPTTISGGTLTVVGSITSDTFVGSNGKLSGDGLIRANIVNDGRVAPGDSLSLRGASSGAGNQLQQPVDSIGNLHVSGDYTQHPGGTYEVDIDDAGNSDHLDVGGTATLAGAVDVKAQPGTYQLGAKYTILSASHVNGQFSTILSDLPAGLRVQVLYYPTFVELLLTTGFTSYALTFNQRQVAIYLDANSSNGNSDFQTMLAALGSLDTSQIPNALQQMEGEVNVTLAQLGVQNDFFLYRLLSNRVMSRGIGGSAIGGSYPAYLSTSNVSFGADAPFTLASYRQPALPQEAFLLSPNDPEWSGWVQGYGLGGNAQSDGNASGGVYGVGGTLAALQRQLDDEHLMGFFGAYSQLNLSLNQVAQYARTDDGQFGSYLYGNDDVNYYFVAGSIGFDDYHSTRKLQFGSISRTATGNYSGWQATSYVERGVNVRLGEWIVQPYLGLQYIYLRQNAFTETGADALNLNVSGIDTNALRGLLGMRAARQWSVGNTVLAPQLRALWLHEFLRPETTLNARFAEIGGASFATQGLNFGREWALLGCGLQWLVTDQLSLFANYDVQVNTVQTFHVGSGGVQYAW